MRVTFWRTFRFEAAHYLSGYEGKCGHIHGHNYVLTVKLNAEPDDNGFVISADGLKQVMKPLIDQLDHALIIDHKRNLVGDGEILSEAIIGENFWSNVVEIGHRPTTENLAIWLYQRIAELPELRRKDVSGNFLYSIGIDLQETHAMGVSIP